MTSPVQLFLFVGLPYLAALVCVVGTLYRVRSLPLEYTARSSQILEGRALLWGSVPWHAGIIVILIGHFVALGIPGLWSAIVGLRPALIAIEATGMGLALLCVFGLVVLIGRRITNRRLQAVTDRGDLLLLLLLLVQVVLGLLTAILYPWGAAWSSSTLGAYVWSLATFQPNPGFVGEMKFVIQAHVIGAWLIVAVFPFTRLIHMLALPVEYLFRPFQKVLWNSPRRLERPVALQSREVSRRDFIQGSVTLASGGILMGTVGAGIVTRYVLGGKKQPQAEARMLRDKIERLQANAEYRQLELERYESPHILIAALGELNAQKGKYFIDYLMRPALAFLGADGYPFLISAKCTHLGCTVGSEIDAAGKLLCPCHVSYFDAHTGKPDPSAPAKVALPRLGWMVQDGAGNQVAVESPSGERRGTLAGERRNEYRLYIVKAHSETTT